MAISKEKKDKIESINNDNSDLIIKIDEYLNYNHQYFNKENIFQSVNEPDIEKDSFVLLFSLEDLEFSMPNFLKIENIIWKETKNINMYYVGKEYSSKIKFYRKWIQKLDKKNLEKFKKVVVIIDVSSISSYPLWNTMMRRRFESIIDKIENIELNDITEEFIKKSIEDSNKKEVEFNNKYDIDFLIEILREISKNSEIIPYFIYAFQILNWIPDW